MMNMEWSILPGYAREEEIRELFTEYTNMVLAGDPTFAGYLAPQIRPAPRPTVPGVYGQHASGLRRAQGAG